MKRWMDCVIMRKKGVDTEMTAERKWKTCCEPNKVRVIIMIVSQGSSPKVLTHPGLRLSPITPLRSSRPRPYPFVRIIDCFNIKGRNFVLPN